MQFLVMTRSRGRQFSSAISPATRSAIENVKPYNPKNVRAMVMSRHWNAAKEQSNPAPEFHMNDGPWGLPSP
jgi:hypothetical protein